MPTPASFSSTAAAPSAVEAVRETLSNLLLLFVIGMITTWAESLIASLHQRTETTDLTDITRRFGTTDIALILERLTTGLQRLRELEQKVRRAVAGLDPDPQLESPSAPSSPLRLSTPRPRALTPEDISILSRLTSEHIVAAPVRATGPPNPRLSPQNPTGPVHPLTPRGMDGPPYRFPLPGGKIIRYLNRRVDVCRSTESA